MTSLLEAALEYSTFGWSTIPIATKKKPPLGFKWKEFQERRPSEVELKRWFKNKNLTGLAVILGPVSGGLYCRDFDCSDSYHSWASLHAEYATKLPTVQASRAPHVYCRSNSQLPTVAFDDGEFRGIGAYIVLPPSVHECGHTYNWLSTNRIPPFGDPLDIGLCEPYSTRPDRIVQRELRGQSEQRKTEKTDAVLLDRLLAEIEFAVRDSLPTIIHENHRRLFHLARWIRAIENQEQDDFSASELLRIFELWYEGARPFLRADVGFDGYRFEFLSALESVRIPLGEDILSECWERSSLESPPEIACQFRSDEVRKLVTFCRELQRCAGDGSFFLSCRTVQHLFEQCSHTTAAAWLRGLVSLKVLELVNKGGPSDMRATRYRYLGPL